MKNKEVTNILKSFLKQKQNAHNFDKNLSLRKIWFIVYHQFNTLKATK